MLFRSKPSRLIRARYKIADILKQRKDGQTALLVYAGDAFTVTPLTDDTETIDSQLSALTTNIMPSDGNNTELVLEKAVELFKQSGLQKGQILLVTDETNGDKALSVAKNLDNYSLSILGVGTNDGAPIALPEGGFLKDKQGSIVVPKLNTSDLENLATAGKGTYQAITANDSDIKSLLANIDKPIQQEGKENKNLLLDQWEDKGPWLLLFVLPLAALSFRKGLLCVGLLLLLPLPKNSYAFEWHDLWQSKDQQAQQAFNKNKFEQAATLFENPDWKAAAQYKSELKELDEMKAPKTATGFYNQGNVLAKSGKYEEAIKAYDEALKKANEDKQLIEDAKYNKELVEKELEKQKQDQQKQDKKEDQSKDNSEQQKANDKSEKSEQQKASEQKPEQSNERKSEQQKADEQKADEDKKQQDKKDNKKAEAQQTEQKKPDDSKADKEKSISAQEKPSTEEQQANEQWLKRIPDDPAGLLKRKFKYQYGQRNH